MEELKDDPIRRDYDNDTLPYAIMFFVSALIVIFIIGVLILIFK